MHRSYKRFIESINGLDNVSLLYCHINDTLHLPLDSSDLLRWEWVQCVSSLDKLVHDLVRTGMIEIFSGIRKPTDNFNTFLVDVSTLMAMIDSRENREKVFESRIIMVHKGKSFQMPSSISDALSSIISDRDKWSVIARKMGITKEDCVTELKNIVIRRNQIVHEGDYADIYDERQRVEYLDVCEVRDFILKLGNAIYEYVRLEDTD